MLLSMTGFGEARFQSDALRVGVELRTVNNRYLKVSIRGPDSVSHLESEMERVLRQVIRRGTIQVQLQVQRPPQTQDYQLNISAVRSYLTQLAPLQSEYGSLLNPSLASLLQLPGIIEEAEIGRHAADEHWPIIEKVLRQALDKLQAMRREEGRAMGQELTELRQSIVGQLNDIRVRAPLVVDQYRDKLQERVRKLLDQVGVELDNSDLIKEVSIFAERSDITEEMVRLASHLDQFVEIMQEPESPGRKLDFLTQEMFRETNTIGSKANDVEIARRVVEIKGAIEKIRELIQNLE